MKNTTRIHGLSPRGSWLELIDVARKKLEQTNGRKWKSIWEVFYMNSVAAVQEVALTQASLWQPKIAVLLGPNLGPIDVQSIAANTLKS